MEPSEKRYCVHCGKEIEKYVVFCPYCGKEQPAFTIEKSDNTEIKNEKSNNEIKATDNQSSETSENKNTNIISEKSESQLDDVDTQEVRRKNRNILIAMAAIAVVVIIILIALISGFQSKPSISVDTDHVKITGKDTTGKLTGKTAANTKVTASNYDGYTGNKRVRSDRSGNFTLKDLEAGATYKLRAKNKNGKSEIKKIKVSGIPSSAHTKLTIKGQDEFGDLYVDKGTKSLKASGTAPKGSIVQIEDNQDNYKVIKKIKVGSNKKWSIQLEDNGTTSKDLMYTTFTITAKVKGLLESELHEVNFANDNYGSDYENKKDTDKNSNSDNTNNYTEDSKPTADDKAALKKAKIYAKDMNMSKAGIYDQLTAKAGDSLSTSSAQYAVDNVKANWNSNALATAKSYKKMSLSKREIYEQLTSKDGDQFTSDEANYATEHLSN